MPRAPPLAFYTLSAIALLVWYIVWTHNQTPVPGLSATSGLQLNGQHGSSSAPVAAVSFDTTSGGAIMGKLGNETAKAELGRAAWKLFHTTMSRFPVTPSADESQALKDYIHLFARLYPCGECAQHFQQILKKYPPQTSSRNSAAAWACFVHNEVNISKGKPVFDCANIGDWYDCGCAEDEKDEEGEKGTLKGHKEQAEKAKSGKSLVEDVDIERDGLMNGG